MIQITDKSKCCGCSACVNACPVQCIVMRRDRSEGFDYPVANPDLCLGCGKCETICPVLNQYEARYPLAAMAVRCDDHVQSSSSGGVFPALAKVVTGEGGVVFGAVMERDFIVGHAEAETMEGVERMRGSKYVQSDPYTSFMDAEQYLKDGRLVLFTGTPCQIAGLKHYLSKEYENLLTADTACHGVPGPGLWEMYMKTLHDKSQNKIASVNFRNKERSWRHYDFTCSDAQMNRCVSVKASDDPYMALFIQNMTLRPSCYSCPARDGRSGSDLTLADLWSVGKTAPELNDDKGASGVLVNTQRGRDFMNRIDVQYMKEVTVDNVKRDNGGFAESVPVPDKREEFFKGLGVAGVDVCRHMKKYVVRKPFHVRIYRSLRSIVSSMKRRVRE